MLRKKYTLTIIAILTMSSIVGCSSNTMDEKSSIVLSNEGQDKQITETNESEKLHEDALKEFLNEIGLDASIVEEKTKTDSGANVVGGAKPVKSYKSLGLAQDAFRDYLGLHNKIESLTDEIYELSNIMIVNKDDFMQAIYSTKPITGRNKVITVKFTKKLPVEDLVKVYFEDGNPVYTEEGNIFGVNYKIYKSDLESELYNLAWFTTENNKSYSIDTKSGLSKNEFEGLLDELIWNVITMEKWEEHNIEN